ncbi:MAG: type II secretion system protein [Planctomycetes bacterium]|nr:type II secretion system protein [Planctomycetota bacterium]
MNTQNAKTRGLTIAEIVIALGVLALALTGVVAAMAHTSVANSLNRQLNIARDAAMQRMEQYRSMDYAVIPAGPETFEVAGLPAPPGAPAGTTGGWGTVTFDRLGAPDDKMMTIRVAISWQSERGVRQFENSTIVSE